MERIHYTVREVGGFMTGAAHYLDQREVDGVWVAHEVAITLKPSTAPRRYIHSIQVDSVQFTPK